MEKEEIVYCSRCEEEVKQDDSGRRISFCDKCRKKIFHLKKI